MAEKEISKAVIARLPRYYRYLGELMEDGVERISSNDLSVRMKVTASQIRQDLNNFGGFGQQGYGYNVKYLYTEIAKILGIDRQHNIVIIGAGNLGQAIANYANFEKRGFLIKGMFDINPRLVSAGIKAIWNFAHTDLVVPDDVVVENVHLSESLMRLSYKVCSMQDKAEEEKAEREKGKSAKADTGKKS